MHVEAGQLDVSHHHDAFKFKFAQRLSAIPTANALDQLLAQWHQDGRVARSVFQLRFRQLKVPVTQPLGFVDDFVQIPCGDRVQSVTLFNVAGANQLAGQQRVKEPAQVRAQRVLDEFRVKLCVVSDLDRTRRGEQIAQRRESVVFRKSPRLPFAKSVEVNDVDAIRASPVGSDADDRCRDQARWFRCRVRLPGGPIRIQLLCEALPRF